MEELNSIVAGIYQQYITFDETVRRTHKNSGTPDDEFAIDLEDYLKMLEIGLKIKDKVNDNLLMTTVMNEMKTMIDKAQKEENKRYE